MRRTTLKLDDDLLRRLEDRAAQGGRTPQALANKMRAVDAKVLRRKQENQFS